MGSPSVSACCAVLSLPTSRKAKKETAEWISGISFLRKMLIFFLSTILPAISSWTSQSQAQTINAAPQYSLGYYANPGTSSTIGGAGATYVTPTSISATDLQTLFSGAAGSVILQNGHPPTQFINPNNLHVLDWDVTAPAFKRSVKEWGAQCDTLSIGLNVVNGSTSVTGYGYNFSSNDVGKTGEAVEMLSGIPTRLDFTITGVTVATNTATISLKWPFATISPAEILLGHDDTAAIAAAFAQQNDNNQAFQIEIPTGVCWSHAIALYGQGISGENSQSVLAGHEGEDVLQQPDPSNLSGLHQRDYQRINDLSIWLGARIDAAKPWQAMDGMGNITPMPAVYRPTGLLTAWANNPLGPGWCLGAQANGNGCEVGVGTVANGSPTLTVLTSVVPTVGQQIIFPYASTGIFETTVSGVSGSTVTLAANYPGTGLTQAEWFAGTTPAASPSGTALQQIQTAIPASGRTFPMTITLANPITPATFTETNVAPYGLVEIDGEQFSYFGYSNLPDASTSGTPSITLTAGAQNGTTAAAHAVNAPIWPLNPFQPALGWPVAPTINGSTQTPASAEFFPAWNIGNAGISFPWTNGVIGSGGGWQYADISDITISVWHYTVGENAIGWQVQNSTAGIYEAIPPFSSRLQNINIIDPQFGIFEGQPSYNAYGELSRFPTADGNVWDNILIQSAGYPIDFLSGGTSQYTSFHMFSENGGETGTSWPGLTPAYLGAGTTAIWSSYASELNGYAGSPLYASNCHGATIKDFYLEAELGAQNQAQPGMEFDCSATHWIGTGDFDNLQTFVGGYNNVFHGGPFQNGAFNPLINYGYNNTYENTLGVSSTLANVYGQSPFINWGENIQTSGMTNNVSGTPTGPFGSVAYGNSAAPYTGQSIQPFAAGNLTAPYVDSQAGFISASEFNANGTVEPSAMSQGWTLDLTQPVTQSYAGCNAGTSLQDYCNTFAFDGSSSGIQIGPGQRLAPGKYSMTLGVRDGTSVSQTFSFRIAVNCTGYTANLVTYDVPVSGTWTNQDTDASNNPLTVDFTGYSGCQLRIVTEQTSASAAQIQYGFVAFVPVPQQPYMNNINIANQILLNGSAGTAGQCPVSAGSGSPTAWGSCSSGGAVSSVFGRTGAVTAMTGDYTAAQVTNAAATNVSNTFTQTQFFNAGSMDDWYDLGLEGNDTFQFHSSGGTPLWYVLDDGLSTYSFTNLPVAYGSTPPGTIIQSDGCRTWDASNSTPLTTDTGFCRPAPDQVTLGNGTSGDSSGWLQLAAIGNGASGNTDLRGQITLSGGSGTYSFTKTYSVAPTCVATDTTSASQVKVSATVTALTVAGTGSDTLNYICAD